MRDYSPSEIEAKWQKKWADAGLHEVDLNKAKDPYYYAIMFPYPSGANLHVGHWFQYGPTDSFARFMKMQGKDVFFPMGFDAFGLPAENYAIKTGVHPDASTRKNVETMIEQFKRMGTMYDWSKTLNSSTPEYYRWTQWLFLQMHKHELAYKKEASVNWCEKDQTVLANEQVHDGKCERCGTEVVQKSLTQWFWHITKYAQPLLDGLEELDWPEKTKLMQKNWIGKSEGAEIRFEIADDRIHEIHENTLADARGNPAINCRVTTDANHRCVHLVFEPKYRRASFEEAKDAEMILRILRDVAKRHDIVVHEAAAMMDHIHLLISFHRDRDLEKDIVKKIKGASAREYLKKYKGEESHLWGEGNHHENVDSEEQFQNVIQYIRNNPKEAGLDSEGRILSHLPFTIAVFTTRPDTLFGATYMVLAPEHPLVETITPKDHWGTVHAYREEVKKKTELQRTDLNKTKTGVPTGAFAINPATKQKIPVWIADYVLMNYGTGAIMAVPGHDERDWEFAKQNKLPIREVVAGGDVEKEVFVGDGTMVNSEFLDGLSVAEAKKKMIAWLENEECGRGVINYRLRDWLVSRQRYWGAPIPIVYDPEGKPHPVPEKHLPWLLPTDVEFKPTGKSPLTESKEFIERTEKIFGKGWTPEYDTMDTFVCSSFYYLRYLMENDEKHFVDPTREKKWMPVDLYIGGPEHACMHLIYARFVMKALKDFGFVSHEEPFKKLVHQGLITNQGAKMSKSKGNVVSPDAFVERHGSDVFRMYLMFMGPYTEGGDWSDTGIKGIDRFVARVWKAYDQYLEAKPEKGAKPNQEQIVKLHQTIKKCGEELQALRFNTAISALMELLNVVEQSGTMEKEVAETLPLLLAPLAPHLADELWERLGKKGFMLEQSWPKYDPSLLKSDTMTIVVQINGKVRGDLQVSASATKEEVLEAAKNVENVVKFLDGASIKKEIYVPGKLVSLVI